MFWAHICAVWECICVLRERVCMRRECIRWGAMPLLTSDESVPVRANAHVHVEARGSASAWSGSASGRPGSACGEEQCPCSRPTRLLRYAAMPMLTSRRELERGHTLRPVERSNAHARVPDIQRLEGGAGANLTLPTEGQLPSTG